MTEEMVFCISRSALENADILLDGPIPLTEPAPLLELECSFIPRSMAEQDEAWKQLIPYQLFVCQDRLLVFQRGCKVNEKRLAGRLSVGIGGHMNKHDMGGEKFGIKELWAAACREREEELEIEGDVEVNTIGLINDDSDEVGRVHIGLVLICRVEKAEQIALRPGAEDLSFVGWWTVDEVQAQGKRFESWSLMAIELMQAVC